MGNFCTGGETTAKDDATPPLNKAGYGISTAEDTKDAVAEAVKGAGIDGPSLAFVSATVKRDAEEVRKAFADALPGVPLHGITSSGALLTSGGSKSGAVGCLLIKYPKESFATAYDEKDGEAAAKALKEGMAKPATIFMGATPGAEEGVVEALGKEFPGVPVYGGTAADDELAGAWSVMSADKSSGTGVSLVGIGPSVKFGAAMLAPYTLGDTTVKATKTEGRRVFEIDGKPAADWAFELLGDEVKEQYENGGLVLPQTATKPFGLKQPSGEIVTAHLASFGGKEGSYIDFFCPIPEGAELNLMSSGDGPSTGYASALAEAYDKAKAAGTLKGGKPVAGILIFCGGMAIAVGDNLDSGLTSKDFSSKVDGLPMLGMTCFGEQGCLPEEKKNVQRNLTVGMILLG
mmetsp:Transcript_11415/g.33649  ORF Transcript_11415/g.33649 Transcript_11415/m.33649 type:complete len:404 (-) Transcript_11415:445-1656(-)